MERKTKILAVGDTHGDSNLTKKLAEQAEKENVDLVVLCGDIIGWAETKNIIKPFKDKNKEVLIIPGNWDPFETIDFLSNLYNIKNLHGYSIIHENTAFFGAGGGTESSLGPNQISEDTLFATLERAHEPIKNIETKIMITHMHPSGSLSEFSGFEGSQAVRKAIDKFKPEILLHGHIHEGAGLEENIGKTRVINVGRQGKIIEV